MKKIISVLIALLIITSMPTMVFAGDVVEDDNQSQSQLSVDNAFQMSESNMTISNAGHRFVAWATDKNISLSHAVSSKTNIAKVTIESNMVVICPQNPGKSKITVYDNQDRKATMTVTIKKSWLTKTLKMSKCYGYRDYTTFNVSTVPNSKVTIKIDGKKYTKRIKTADGSAEINVKKHFRKGKKYSVKFSYKGKSYTKNFKVESLAFATFGTIWTCKPQVPINARNVFKGDVICVTVNGKTYKHKVKYNSSSYNTTIYAKSNLGYVPHITIKVKDKHGTKLYSRKELIHWN